VAPLRLLVRGVLCEPAECADQPAVEADGRRRQPRAGGLVHLDLYRVADDERELAELGLPDLLDGKIGAVEWPGPTAARVLRFRYRVALEAADASRRRIRIESAGREGR